VNCRSARSALYEAADLGPRADGGLATDARLELDAHLVGCADCRTLERALAQVEAALARWPAPPVDHLDLDEQVARVRAALEHAADAQPAVRAPRRPLQLARWVPWLAAAAGILAAWALFGRGPTRVSDGAPTAPPLVEGGPGGGAVEPEPRPAPGRADTHAEPDALPERDAPVELASTPDATSAPTPLTEAELARQAAAREQLARELKSVWSQHGTSGDEQLAAALTQATRELEREGWPVARLCETLLDGADPELARAALRWLGLHGDRTALPALERALAVAALRAEAVAALVDLGAPAAERIVQACTDGELEPLFVARLAAAQDAASAQVLERLARRALRPHATRETELERGERLAQAGRLLDALGRAGPRGAESLVRLADERLLTGAELAEELHAAQGSRALLARLIGERPRGASASVLIPAVERVRPDGALAWLTRQLQGERELREAALAALVRWNEAESLAAVLAAEGAGRASRDASIAALESALADAPAAVATLVAERSRARDRAALQVLVETLPLRAHGPATPALIELAACELVLRAERRECLLLAGEVGLPEHAEALAALYPGLPHGERELRAACLAALHRLGGSAALRQLFARNAAGAERALERLCALLEAPGARENPTSTLLRVAQELESSGLRVAP